MENSKFKYGQRNCTLNEAPCRAILVPHPPLDVDDRFIARMYSKAMKPTTIDNMYSRWIGSTTNLMSSTIRAPFPAIDYDCKALLIAINSDDHIPNHYAIAAALQAMSIKVFSEMKYLKHLEIGAEPFLYEDEPQILMLIQPYDKELADTIFVTNEDLVQITDAFRR